MENNKYAIIQSGGKQHRVAVGDLIDVELLHLDKDAKVAFEEVLFAADGSDVKFGSPTLANAVVHGTVVDTVKGNKITTLKYKRSHNQCRKWGHRQKYTRVKITEIGIKP